MSSQAEGKPKGKTGALRTMVTAFRKPAIRREQTQESLRDENGAKNNPASTHVTVHQAAREGNIEALEWMMEKIPHLQVRKKRLNQRDDSKLTPLHYAARYNHRRMIEYLVENGANVHAKAEDELTALHFLSKYKPKFFLPGTSVEVHSSGSESDEKNEMPKEECLSCVQLLVRKGAQVNAKDDNGQTPLHLACARGNTRVVRQLLECHGLALEMADHQGMTALHVACLYGHRTIVRLLAQEGANLRCVDKDLTTPMHLACAEGLKQIATILLSKARERESSGVNNSSKTTTFNGTNDRKSSLATIAILATPKIPESPLVSQAHPMSSIQGQSSDPDGAGSLLRDLDSEKNMPLHLAIENGHLDLTKYCIENMKAAGIESIVTSVRSCNTSCLHLAVQANSLELVKLLLEEGADLNARNSSQVTPLYLACQHNSHVIVKYLLERGCDVETKDTDYMTPFLVASRYGHLETLNWLMEYKASVTATDKDDKTCLMWAAEEDRPEAIRLLMKNHKVRMSIEERDKFNNTALHLAAMKGHSASVKLLLDYKASTEIKNDDDRNTLHMAAFYGHHAIIPDLVNRDKSIINAGDEDANTVLHLAAIGGNNKCVTILIQLGVNIELRNAKQWTALDCACAFGFVKPAKALLEAGAAIEPTGKVKISPLHLACQRGHVEVVNLLLEWKADVTFRSVDGRNALDYAIDCGQKDCVLSLIKHETWQDSMKNVSYHPVTGDVLTPMRKLISKMQDMAEIVCNQCIEDNGKKPDDDDFAITLFYELFDDMYVATEWAINAEVGKQGSVENEIGYSVFDEQGQLTEEAQAYDNHSDTLLENHPLKLMVKSKCESLLKHPIVTGLLNYKWRKFGRYVYYSGLLIFLIYMVLLNVYMAVSPLFYEIDWVQMINNRKNISGVNNTNNCTNGIVYRADITSTLLHLKPPGCQYIDANEQRLRWAILALSAINLFYEMVKFSARRLTYITFTNFLTVTLYLLTLLMSLNFKAYTLENISKLTYPSNTDPNDTVLLDNLQQDTGLRQQWQLEIGAFSIFLSWMVLLLFIRRIPKLGIFVVMFTDVLKTFAEFFPVFVFFVLGFALSFSILFGNQYVFHYWYWSIITTGVMMVGEINYESKFFGNAGKAPGSDYFTEVYSQHVAVIVFLFFLVVMTIIIMNLLVGLAVGDIIQVQENASLERLGMQVDLTLEVEFALPEFLRKKFFLHTQTIEVNKYRKSNFFKRFFLSESAGMELERIQKNADIEVVDQDDELSDMDRVISGMNNLRNRVNDLLSEVADVRQDVANVQAQVREVQNEAKEHTEEIKTDVVTKSDQLQDRIHKTHTFQLEKTQQESDQTRGEVDDTRNAVARLLHDIERTRTETRVLIFEMESRLESLQETIAQRHWTEFEKRLTGYHEVVEKNRNAMKEDLDNIKFILTQKQAVSRV